MGRLTLNVLLSFAQFEREVTGERIRDKIAASKAKGMWMGGTPMLGYQPSGRKLIVDESEAETVRLIFRRYIELKSVHALAEDLERRGVRAKLWTTQRGKLAGGGVLGRGALLHLLRNRTYLGEIPHKGRYHPGQHEAIIDQCLFDSVQEQLRLNNIARSERPLRLGGSPLTGRIFDDRGMPMSPTHSRGRSGKAHRYYVTNALLTGKARHGGSLPRVPAECIETLVLAKMRDELNDPTIEWRDAHPAIKRVTVSIGEILITMTGTCPQPTAAGLSKGVGDSDERIVRIAARLGRRGGAAHFLDAEGKPISGAATIDPVLVQALARGWRWRTLLASGAFETSTDLAKAEGVTLTTVKRLTRLAYLAPDLIRDILDGRQRSGMTLDHLVRATLPLDWNSQRQLIGRKA